MKVSGAASHLKLNFHWILFERKEGREGLRTLLLSVYYSSVYTLKHKFVSDIKSYTRMLKSHYSPMDKIWETNQMPINPRMDKLWHRHNETLDSNDDDWTTATCNNMVKYHKQILRKEARYQNQINRKTTNILYDPMYINHEDRQTNLWLRQ